MREILFRGKAIVNEEWVEGSYMEHYYSSRFGRISAIFINNDNLCKTSRIPVIPITVGQYTDLTDKNERKIFEGDIVRVKYDENGEEREDVTTVSWSSQEASFSPWNWDYSCDGCDCACEITSIEVIGNIHDNPELLGGDSHD